MDRIKENTGLRQMKESLRKDIAASFEKWKEFWNKIWRSQLVYLKRTKSKLFFLTWLDQTWYAGIFQANFFRICCVY